MIPATQFGAPLSRAEGLHPHRRPAPQAVTLPRSPTVLRGKNPGGHEPPGGLGSVSLSVFKSAEAGGAADT